LDAASTSDGPAPADGAAPEKGPTTADGPFLTPLVDAGPPMPKSYPTFTAGTRLSGLYMVPADGAKQFVSLFDKQHQARCEFTVASDGKLRCLPAGEDKSDLRVDTYSDACMTPQPIGFSYACNSKPRFAVGPGNLTCGLEVRPLGAERHTPVYTVGHGFGLSCPQESVPNGTYFEAGAALPPSEFVDAELVTERTGARVGAVYAVASDGTRALRSLFDTALGAECRIERAMTLVPETMWCLPATTTTPNGYADAACTMPVATPVGTSSCPSPDGPPAALVTAWSLGSVNLCDPGQRFFEMGEALAPKAKTYAVDATRACSPSVGVPADTKFVRGGREVKLQTFGREVVPGAGRLLAVDYVDPQGVRTASGTEWMDQTRNELCEFARAADDQSRCLPRALGNPLYGDAACTQLVVGWTPTACAPTMPTAVRDPELTTCGYRIHVRERGPRLPAVPATFYIVDGNQHCAALDLGPNRPTEVYAVGAEIPATSFVAGVLTVE
jgi:hypothetical protein